MKLRSLIYAVLLAALPMFASATDKPPPKPPHKPPVTKPHTTNTTNSSTSDSKSAAEAAAAAAAAAKANAGAEVNSDIGVENALSNQSPSSASVQDSSSVNARAWSLFVPPPVFTPPMPRPEVPVLCPAPTETQSALAVGSGVIFSKADSMRDNDPCTAIKYSQLLWDRCQYKKADRALNIGLKLFAKKAGEDWDAAPNPDLMDYNTKDCTALRAPPPQPATLVNYVYEMSPPPACEAPKATKTKGIAGASKRKVKCS